MVVSSDNQNLVETIKALSLTISIAYFKMREILNDQDLIEFESLDDLKSIESIRLKDRESFGDDEIPQESTNVSVKSQESQPTPVSTFETPENVQQTNSQPQSSHLQTQTQFQPQPQPQSQNQHEFRKSLNQTLITSIPTQLQTVQSKNETESDSMAITPKKNEKSPSPTEEVQPKKVKDSRAQRRKSGGIQKVPPLRTSVQQQSNSESVSPRADGKETNVNPGERNSFRKQILNKPLTFVQKMVKKGDVHDNLTLHFLESRPDLIYFKKDFLNYPLVKVENYSVTFQINGPPEDDPWSSGSSDDSVWGCCLSTYPLGSSGKREGSPICDFARIMDLDERMIVVVSDGCSWGKAVREAAEKASQTFLQYLLTQTASMRTTHDVAHTLLSGIARAHQSLCESQAKKKWSSATCTLLGGMLTRVHLPQREVGWMFLFLSLGDCKAFHYSKKTRSFTDITHTNRNMSHDASDPGGRIGPVKEDMSPDLRNLQLHSFFCEPDDIIVILSDGVHDNLDPQLLAIQPEDIDPDCVGLDWSQIAPEVAHELKRQYMPKLMKQIVLSHIANNILVLGESESDESVQLPRPVVIDRPRKVISPPDPFPTNFHFEPSLKENKNTEIRVDSKPENSKSDGKTERTEKKIAQSHERELHEMRRNSSPDLSSKIIQPDRENSSENEESEVENSIQGGVSFSNDVVSSPQPTSSSVMSTTSPRLLSTQIGQGSSNLKTISNISVTSNAPPLIHTASQRFGKFSHLKQLPSSLHESAFTSAEETSYLKCISTKIVSCALVDHAALTTRSSRTFLEQKPNDKLPSDYREYPGKMDHSTCVTFRVPH